MSQETAAPAERAFGEGVTNSRRGSIVEVFMPGDPMALLRPETGEVIVVPKEDSNLLRSHYNTLSNLVAEKLSATRVLGWCEEHLRELMLGTGSFEQIAQARSVLAHAIEWHEKSHEELRAEYAKLAPLREMALGPNEAQPATEEDEHNAAKGPKLVELIVLTRGPQEARDKDREETMDWKREGGAFKKKITSIKSAAELKDLGKWPKRMPEKIVYINSDKLKSSWPKLKDSHRTKWSDIYKKGPTGKRSLDRSKLSEYINEQVLKHKSSMPSMSFNPFYEDLKYGDSGTLKLWSSQAEMVNHFNDTHTYDKKVPTQMAGHPLEVELNAGAQLMRYSYGGSVEGPRGSIGREVGVKVEGHAAVDFAKAQASLELFCPREDGWLWSVKDEHGQTHYLLAARCRLTLEVSSVVGASLAGELAMKVEVGSVENGTPKVAGARGLTGAKARRKKTVSINTDDQIGVGTLDAEVAVFAGLKADASITGVIEWRDPEHPTKEFGVIASVAATAGGVAGVSAEAKFKIDYMKGAFRLSTHASLCLGVGAEGALEFEVGAEQMMFFCSCLFHNIAYWGFQNLRMISDDAIKALSGMVVLAVKEGKTIKDFYMVPLNEINNTLKKINAEMAKAEERIALARKVLAKPEALKYALPEAKGMLIYQLMRHSFADAFVGDAVMGASYLGLQRRAVLELIKTATTKDELKNIVQHVELNGKKLDESTVSERMRQLQDFFRTEAVHDFNIPFYDSIFLKQYENALDKMAYEGHFDQWYLAVEDHLMERLPHGHELAEPRSIAYELLRDDLDHPLFASSGWHAYYMKEG